MKQILNTIKAGLKEGNEIEIEVPLTGYPENNESYLSTRRSPANVAGMIKKHLKLTGKADKLKIDDPNAPYYPGKDDHHLNQTTTSDQPNTKQHTEIGDNETVTDLNPCNDSEQAAEATTNQPDSATENQYSNSAVSQTVNPYEMIKKATDQRKTVNNFKLEIEKSHSIEAKHEDRREMNQIKNRLSVTPTTPIADDIVIPDSLPLNVFPELWQLLIRAVANYFFVPIEAVAICLLGAVFIAAHGNFAIKVKEDYMELLTAYIVVAMPSGSRKSAIVSFFRAIFDKFVTELQAEYDKKLPIQKLKAESFKKTKKKLMKDLMKEIDIDNLSEIHGQIGKIADALAPLENDVKKIPARPKFFIDTPTPKGLAVEMEKQGGTLSIFEAEAGLFKHRLRPNDDNLLLKGFTGEPFGDETSTNNSVTMDSPCLTICSFIQPNIFKTFFSNEDFKDHGASPRTSPAFISPLKGIQAVDPLEVPPELKEMYEAKMIKILKFQPPKGTNGKERTLLELTQESYAIHVDFTRKIASQGSAGKFKSCEAFRSKLAGLAARLAGAIHLLQHDEPWNAKIESSAMYAGIAIADFFAEHAISAFDKDRNVSIKFANKIKRWIKRNRISVFSQRRAQRGVGHCKAPQISAGITLLERNHYVARYTDFNNKTTIIVNPNIFKEIDHV